MSAVDGDVERAVTTARVEPAAAGPALPVVPRFGLITAFITLVAAVNGLIGLGSVSIARDEGFSISTSLRSWSSLVKLSIHTETNAWLYAFVLKAWSALGTSPAVLRMPSTIFITASVALTAIVARRLFGDRVALFAAGAMAVHGGVLMFAQQVRTYGLAVLLAVLATLAFVAEVRRPSRVRLVTWVVLVALTAQTQLHTVTIFLPHLIALAGLPVADRRWKRRVGSLLVGLVVIAPVPLAISRHEEGQSLFSLRPGVFRDVLFTFAGRAGLPGLAVYVLAGVVVLVLTRRTWPEGLGWRRFSLLLVASWAVVPFFVLLIASVVLQPTLIGRYLLFCVPAYCIALGLTADQILRRGWRRPVAIAVVAVLGLGAARGSLSWHVDSGTERWNEVTSYVFANARPTDRMVLANDSIMLFFQYERTRQPSLPAGPQPGYPAGSWTDYGTGTQRYESPTPEELAAVAKDAPRIWVVIGRKHVNTGVMDERLKALAPDFKLVETRHFPVEIDVMLYERTNP